MVEPGGMAGEPGLDGAQAVGAGELPEQERQKMTLAVQLPHPVVGLVLIDEPVEQVPGNLLGDGVKDAIVMAHNIDPLLVSRCRRNIQKRVESMSCTLSTVLNRTAVGQARQ